MKKRHSLFSGGSAKKNITIFKPSEIEITFDNLIGLDAAKEDLKDVVNYIKNPEAYEKLNVRPHMHYVISGIDGIGKTSLAFAVAHEAEIPIVVVDCKNFADARKDAFKLLTDAFNKASSFEYAVLLFKGFDSFFDVKEDFKLAFLSTLTEYLKAFENLVVITTLAVSFNLIGFDFLFDEDGFSKCIKIEPPDLKVREKMFTTFCKDLPLDEDVSLSRVATDCYDMTAKDIKRIIRNATLLAVRNNCSTVNRNHFDEIISLEMLGQKRKKMTDKERLSTAYHEAGHVIAGYFSNPEYKLSKVEIIHRTSSMGVTMQENDEDKLSWFKSDWENRIISSLGGMVAERIIYGENSSGVSEDLATATSFVKLMIIAYGMDDEFGPYSVYESFLEDSSLVGPRLISETLLTKVYNLASKHLNDLYSRCETIIKEHFEELEALTKALVEKEVVYGNEIKEIFENCKKQNQN